MPPTKKSIPTDTASTVVVPGRDHALAAEGTTSDMTAAAVNTLVNAIAAVLDMIAATGTPLAMMMTVNLNPAAISGLVNPIGIVTAARGQEITAQRGNTGTGTEKETDAAGLAIAETTVILMLVEASLRVSPQRRLSLKALHLP